LNFLLFILHSQIIIYNLNLFYLNNHHINFFLILVFKPYLQFLFYILLQFQELRFLLLWVRILALSFYFQESLITNNIILCLILLLLSFFILKFFVLFQIDIFNQIFYAVKLLFIIDDLLLILIFIIQV